MQKKDVKVRKNNKEERRIKWSKFQGKMKKVKEQKLKGSNWRKKKRNKNYTLEKRKIIKSKERENKERNIDK